MDKLENALYVVVRKNITSENYKKFNDLYSSYKKLYEMDTFTDQNQQITQEVYNILNDIKNTYYEFNISNFNNIILEYNELLNNVLTSSYNIKRIQENETYNVDELSQQPIYKYKFSYLMQSNNIDFNKPIEIDITDNLNISKNNDIITIGKALNNLISEKNIHIQNILTCIFNINKEYFKITDNDTEFNELSIPGKIITCIDNTSKNKDIELQMYKNIYNKFKGYLNNDNNISKIDFIKYIADNIYPFNVDDIEASINDIDIIKEFQSLKIDDNTTIAEYDINSITDIKVFEQLNKKVFENLTNILKLKDHTESIKETLNTDIHIEIPIDKIDKTIPFKTLLYNIKKNDTIYFNTINRDYFLKSLTGKNQFNALKDITFSSDNSISNLGEGMFVNIKKQLNKYLNDDVKTIFDILGKDVLSLLLPDNLDNIENSNINAYCEKVFKNTIDKTEAFQSLFNIFNDLWRTKPDDFIYIKLFYSIVFQ